MVQESLILFMCSGTRLQKDNGEGDPKCHYNSENMQPGYVSSELITISRNHSLF